MKDNHDHGDAFAEERFGRSSASRNRPRQRALWYGGCLLIALALLISFYIVLNQSVSRAHLYWAEAGVSQRVSTEACGSARARAACASGNADGSRLHGSSPAGLIATGR